MTVLINDELELYACPCHGVIEHTSFVAEEGVHYCPIAVAPCESCGLILEGPLVMRRISDEEAGVSTQEEPMDQMTQGEQVAKAFHEAYERLAPDHGYETREASAKPWEEVPEQNRGLMVAVVDELIANGQVAIPGADMISTQAAEAYLDSAIRLWRRVRDGQAAPPEGSDPALAVAYVDAYQSARVSLVGSTLEPEDPTPPGPPAPPKPDEHRPVG